MSVEKFSWLSRDIYFISRNEICKIFSPLAVINWLGYGLWHAARTVWVENNVGPGVVFLMEVM
jgi:hypothetical protein